MRAVPGVGGMMMSRLDAQDDRPGREEEQRLEEGVRHQVEHARHVGTQADGGNHEAQLADGGIGQHLLDVVLRHGNGRREQRGGRAHHGHHTLRGRREGEKRVRAGHHVDTGGDHGRRMDQRGDRRRAGHGVRQPDEERDLRGFAGGANQEAEGDEGRQRRDGRAQLLHPHEDGIERQAAEVGVDEEDGDEKTGVADAVGHKGLLAGQRIADAILALLVPEADEQVRAQPDALPTDEQGQEAVAAHQNEHGGQEQVEVDEEARVAPGVLVEAHVFVHVAGGIDVDERADARDDEHHRHGKRIHLEGPRHIQRTHLQPRG